MSAAGQVAMLVQVVGWCLVHFLWQGLFVGVLYAAARLVLPRGNPRYLAAMASMILLAAAPIATGWREFQVLAGPVGLGDVLVGAGAGVPAAATPAAAGWLAALQTALPWLVLAWACGVALLALRIGRQWLDLRALVRAAAVLPDWQARARAFGRRLGLRNAVGILASARIATPTLVGWLRPVVVVPLALLARMPSEQIDLVLAHELAHLRRLDHLANLFQVLVETLLFYHPVVHWISRDARNERELCCDALALQASRGKRRDFVAALAALAEFRIARADLVLAASGGLLVERAWFVLGEEPARRRGHAGLVLGAAALLGLAVTFGLAWRGDPVRQRAEHVLAADGAALRQGLDALAARPLPLAYRPWDVRPELRPLPPAQVLAPAQERHPAPPRDRQILAAPPVLSVPDIQPPGSHTAALVARPVAASASVSPWLAAPAPRVVRTAAPAYPPGALASGVEGRVEIQFELDATGVPENLRVVDSSASGQLDEAALAALAQWRFAPPAAAGRRYRQSFTFRLGGGAGAADTTVARDCLPSTGTHICRRPYDRRPGVRVFGPRH